MTISVRKLADALRAEASGPLDADALDVTHDSRRVASGAVFVAIPGQNADGNEFVPAALDAGAVAIVSERPVPGNFPVAWLRVADARRALPVAAAAVFRDPSAELRLVGITGTNGKTTTAFLTEAVIREAEGTSALISTVTNRVGDRAAKAVRTTPEASDVQRLLREAVDAGCRAAVMEATSIAVELGRVEGLQFDTVAFTNLTRDHLDFHGTMEAYFAAKQKLFTGAVGPKPRRAVVNSDDEYGRMLATSIDVPVITFGLGDGADVRAESYELSLDGLRMDVATPEGRFEIGSPLVGRPYVYNILATVGIGLALGYDVETLGRALEACEGAPGRFQKVPNTGGFAVVVDYAHTDDALRKVLETARELTRGRVITVFGCGGDRDRTKRAPMGHAAGSLSDLAILTSDNPRSEDPLEIIRDAEAGLVEAGRPYETFVDRTEAIHRAIAEAREGDIVVIAGKGHEDYQILGDRTIHYDDREQAREALRERGLVAGVGR